MNRRDFLKIVGITAATSTAALYGCGSKEGSSEGSKVLGPIPTDKMTYRSFPGLGSDKVSILGYGCMRWPTVPAPDGKGEMIDQDAVNELVDYAIAHGVNGCHDRGNHITGDPLLHHRSGRCLLHGGCRLCLRGLWHSRLCCSLLHVHAVENLALQRDDRHQQDKDRKHQNDTGYRDNHIRTQIHGLPPSHLLFRSRGTTPTRKKPI